MESIDTFYMGNYFRSRLEAKWAIFFDAAGIIWEYEPTGFKDNGRYYLPDFYLPFAGIRMGMDLGVYVEIKPESYLQHTIPAAEWFNKPLVLFCGTPDRFIHGLEYYENGYELYPEWDNYMAIFKCSYCGHVKIEFQEGNYNECPKCKKGGQDIDRMVSAYSKALKARFEHQDFNQ